MLALYTLCTYEAGVGKEHRSWEGAGKERDSW